MSFASGIGCKIGSDRPRVSSSPQSRGVVQVLRAYSLEYSNEIAFADRDVRSTAKVLSRLSSVEIFDCIVDGRVLSRLMCVSERDQAESNTDSSYKHALASRGTAPEACMFKFRAEEGKVPGTAEQHELSTTSSLNSSQGSRVGSSRSFYNEFFEFHPNPTARTGDQPDNWRATTPKPHVTFLTSTACSFPSCPFTSCSPCSCNLTVGHAFHYVD